MSKLRLLVLFAVVVITAAIAFVVFRGDQRDLQPSTEKLADSAGHITIVKSAQPASSAVGQTPSVIAPLNATPAAIAPLQQLQALLNSKTPDDWAEAYRILQECEASDSLRALADNLPRSEEGNATRTRIIEGHAEKKKVCDTYPRELMVNRFITLDRALKENSRAAAIYSLQYGPSGDMRTLEDRKADPVVQQWHARAIEMLERHAASGDSRAAARLAADAEFGLYPSKASTYAYNFVHLQLVKRRAAALASESDTNLIPALESQLTALNAALNPDERKEATRIISALSK